MFKPISNENIEIRISCVFTFSNCHEQPRILGIFGSYHKTESAMLIAHVHVGMVSVPLYIDRLMFRTDYTYSVRNSLLRRNKLKLPVKVPVKMPSANHRNLVDYFLKSQRLYATIWSTTQMQNCYCLMWISFDCFIWTSSYCLRPSVTYVYSNFHQQAKRIMICPINQFMC